MKKELSITINAPLLKTFTNMISPQGLRSFLKGKLHTEFHHIGDSEVPLGTKFKHKIAGMYEFNGEVIAYRKPLLFGIGLNDTVGNGTLFYHFKEIDKKTTELRCELEIFDAHPMKKALYTMMSPLFEKLIMEQLESVKALAEKKK